MRSETCSIRADDIAKYDYIEGFEVARKPTIIFSEGIEIYKSLDNVKSKKKAKYAFMAISQEGSDDHLQCPKKAYKFLH